MTKLTCRDFQKQYGKFLRLIDSNWNTDGGPKSTFRAKDQFFMMLCFLKHDFQKNVSAIIFRSKTSASEKMISSFIRLTLDQNDEWYVLNIGSSLTINNSFEDIKHFPSFPHSLYATDVTFQQCLKPAGPAHKDKLYFSGKHKLYGLKVQVSVLPK